METYNGKLCITHAELINGIMSAAMVKYSTRQGGIERMRRGCNSTPALFAVDSLPLKYRTEVYRRYPDMKAQADSKPFIESIEPDGAALVFYQDHLLDDGKHLPTDKQHEYANNAAILNGFRARLESIISKRSGKGIPKTKFWRLAAQALPRIADTFPNSLPENPRRLQEKFNQYLREGYPALITGKYGTRNRAKVRTNEQESIIIKLLADPRNLDNMQIVELYNTVGRALGWDEVTVKAIRTRREKYDLTISAGRLGATRFRNQREMQVTRSRPTAPLLYWTLDGWTAELLYQATVTDKRGHSVTTYHNRLCMVVVLDPCNNYPVGYAIGDHETPTLIKEALRNAANHTAQLFGCRYRTNQIQSDRYAYKKMKGTYEVMGEKSTPARAHNSKGKVIEPYFGYFNKKYCQLQRNWGGFGITSNPNNQPNSEFLNKHRHGFPDEAGCRQQLIRFIEAERAEKLPQYMELFAGLPEERKLPLSDEQYLLEFGAETGHLNAIEGQGLRPTIGGIKREYDCFDPNFRAYAHIRWAVKYDPDNLNSILAVNEDGSLRFMLEGKYLQPMALADRKEGDAEQLARVQHFNKQLESAVSTRLAVAGDTVEQLFLDNPQLDIPTRLLLCDSRGQNKIHKQTRRVKALEIEDVESVEFTMVKTIATRTDEVEDTKDLY